MRKIIKKKMSIIKEDRDYMSGYIRYIKFIGDLKKIYYWREKKKGIAIHKEMLKYLTKVW